MKKVLYSVAIVAALGLASCGAKTEEKTTENTPAPAPETEVVEVATTTCCTENQECTNEECNKDGECTAEECQKTEGQCCEAKCPKAACPEAACPETNN